MCGLFLYLLNKLTEILARFLSDFKEVYRLQMELYYLFVFLLTKLTYIPVAYLIFFNVNNCEKSLLGLFSNSNLRLDDLLFCIH